MNFPPGAPGRGWFAFTGKLASRIARQIVATGAMAALLVWLVPLLEPYWRGNAFERVWSLGALCLSGAVVFFAVAVLIGALDKDLVRQLTRRRAVPKAEGPPNLSE